MIKISEVTWIILSAWLLLFCKVQNYQNTFHDRKLELFWGKCTDSNLTIIQKNPGNIRNYYGWNLQIHVDPDNKLDSIKKWDTEWMIRSWGLHTQELGASP